VSRRGHTLLLIMVVLAMSAAAGTVFFTRLSLEQAQVAPDELRVQALWLVRSALDAGVSSPRRVETALGPAAVSVGQRGGAAEVEVELAGGHAVVGGEPYQERWYADRQGAE